MQGVGIKEDNPGVSRGPVHFLAGGGGGEARLGMRSSYIRARGGKNTWFHSLGDAAIWGGKGGGTRIGQSRRRRVNRRGGHVLRILSGVVGIEGIGPREVIWQKKGRDFKFQETKT